MIIGTSMTEADVAALLAWPHSNICTDGSLKDRHPRGAGSFPRVLAHYVRDAGLLSLEAAVHKMSGLAAHHMGFEGRGLVAPGHQADLVLVDPERVVDRATTSDPFLVARGIDRVWVNGVQVWRAGAATGNYPGRVIRRVVSGN